jgi:hypothetical protein
MVRIRLILEVAAVMATMLVASAVPALARVEQEAVDQVVNQAQVAVKEADNPTAYQAVEQAQNSNRVTDRSPIQSGGSITVSDALFLVGTVALLIAGGVPTHRVIWRQSQRR